MFARAVDEGGISYSCMVTTTLLTTQQYTAPVTNLATHHVTHETHSAWVAQPLEQFRLQVCHRHQRPRAPARAIHSMTVHPSLLDVRYPAASIYLDSTGEEYTA